MDPFNERATIRNIPFFSTFLTKRRDGSSKMSYRMKRWMVVITIHLLFFLSFALDVQVLEGTLSGSRFLGFHLIDIYTAMQMFLASYHLPINVVIGGVTVFILYWIAGGKSYCAWVCPYGLLSEIGEKWHETLVAKHIIKSRRFDPRIRHIFWLIFLILALSSSYLVFELFNVVGILSRFITYGWSIALSWVLVVFLVEVFYSKRAWCSYICPVGTTYGYIGKVSALRVSWNDNCDHCMVCHDVCFEKQVLELTKPKYDEARQEEGIKSLYVSGADCTLCGRCIDVCHSDALAFDFKLKDLV